MLDLTLKVIQVQQIEICGTVLVTPIVTGLTPPVSPPQQLVELEKINNRGLSVHIEEMSLTIRYLSSKIRLNI